MRRLLRGLGWLFSAPRRGRQVAAYVLDLEFAARSPIAEASDRLLDRLGEDPVWVPPAGLIESGNQDREGLAYLAALGQAISAKVIFEIGTYNGVTAWTMARNVLQATIHTLDLAPGANPALPLGLSDAGNIIPYGRRAYENTPEAARIRSSSTLATPRPTTIPNCSEFAISSTLMAHIRSPTSETTQTARFSLSREVERSSGMTIGDGCLT
jgi:hypothetical protein